MNKVYDISFQGPDGVNGAQGPSGFSGIDVRRHEATTATAKKLNFALSVLRLFHVGHVVQKRRAALSFARHEWLLCNAMNVRFPAASVALSSEPQIGSLSKHDDDESKNVI